MSATVKGSHTSGCDLFKSFLQFILVGVHMILLDYQGQNIVLYRVLFVCGVLIFYGFSVFTTKSLIVKIAQTISAAGAGLNFTVLLANGGRMPVYNCPEKLSSTIHGAHVIGQSSMKLHFLADRFALGHWAVYSIGDVIIVGAIVVGISLSLIVSAIGR